VLSKRFTVRSNPFGGNFCCSLVNIQLFYQGASVDNLPKWNFDGSSTGQAPGDDSEVILRPCRIFKDPFRPRSDGVDNILVICDTYTPAGEALPTNSRAIGEFQLS
jgi:hypothetical protein